MRLMIVCNHDRRGDLLSNELVLVVLNCKDDLKSKFLILVSTVACDPHGCIYLIGTVGDKWLCSIACGVGRRLTCRCLPVLDFVSIENNHPLCFIFVPRFFLFYLLDLLPCCSLSLSRYATSTDFHITTI